MSEPELSEVLEIGRRAGRSLFNPTKDNRWADDLIQEGMIGSFDAYQRGHRDPGILFKAGRTRAIDFLRNVTQHRRNHAITAVIPFDEPLHDEGGTVADVLVDDHPGPEAMTADPGLDLSAQEAAVAELLQLGYVDAEVGFLLGVTGSRISQILRKVRERHPEYADRHRKHLGYLTVPPPKLVPDRPD